MLMTFFLFFFAFRRFFCGGNFQIRTLSPPTSQTPNEEVSRCSRPSPVEHPGRKYIIIPTERTIEIPPKKNKKQKSQIPKFGYVFQKKKQKKTITITKSRGEHERVSTSLTNPLEQNVLCSLSLGCPYNNATAEIAKLANTCGSLYLTVVDIKAFPFGSRFFFLLSIFVFVFTVVFRRVRFIFCHLHTRPIG